MLALRQGGSHQGKTGMILVFDTILCGVMGLSWIYPGRNAILDWVTNAVGLTAGDKGRDTVNLRVVSLAGRVAGESQDQQCSRLLRAPAAGFGVPTSRSCSRKGKGFLRSVPWQRAFLPWAELRAH